MTPARREKDEDEDDSDKDDRVTRIVNTPPVSGGFGDDEPVPPGYQLVTRSASARAMMPASSKVAARASFAFLVDAVGSKPARPAPYRPKTARTGRDDAGRGSDGGTGCSGGSASPTSRAESPP